MPGGFESAKLVIYAAYLLTGVATFLFVRLLVREQESRIAQESLDEARSRKASSPLVKITRPFFTQYFVPMIRGKEFWDNRRVIFRRRLITAGLKEELTADEFLAYKLFLILFFPLVAGFLKALGILDMSLFWVFASGVAGWFYPDLWVKSRIQKRQRAIVRTLPFVVDLLALSTEAGLDFIGAIGKVVEKSVTSPLIDELEQLLKEIKIGSSRAAALREMALRIDLPEVSSFSAILVSADQMGASIGKILRQQSEQMRSQRFLAAEKAGAAAAQKLIFPLVFCIVPAVMLMVFGPFALGMLGK